MKQPKSKRRKDVKPRLLPKHSTKATIIIEEKGFRARIFESYATPWTVSHVAYRDFPAPIKKVLEKS